MLCLASILSTSGFGIDLFVPGAALFLPASTRLANRLSPQPGSQGPDNTKVETKKRPILGSSLTIAFGLFGLGSELSGPSLPAGGAPRYAMAGAFVLVIGWGILSLVKAFLRPQPAQTQQ